MGKRLKQQRRGKGTPRYKSPSHRYGPRPQYTIEKESQGIVQDIVHKPGRTAPLALAKYGEKKERLIATSGMRTGQKIAHTNNSKGDIVSLKELSVGDKVCNIELHPGDGGKLCRSSGTFAIIVSKTGDKITVLLPSKRIKKVNKNCRATKGKVAGHGRKDLPFRKAGKKYHTIRSKAQKYPTVRGRAMNAVDHPFGGGATGRSKSISKNAPPGKKVGNISPKQKKK